MKPFIYIVKYSFILISKQTDLDQRSVKTYPYFEENVIFIRNIQIDFIMSFIFFYSSYKIWFNFLRLKMKYKVLPRSGIG